MSVAAVRPRRLVPGDTVAIVSPSWGGPERLPARLRSWPCGPSLVGPRGSRTAVGPRGIRPASTGSARPRRRPQRRVRRSRRSAAVVASIGGDDSIRLLPFLDEAAIVAEPDDPHGLLGHDDVARRRPPVRVGHVPRPFRDGRPVAVGEPAARRRDTRARRVVRCRIERTTTPRFDRFAEGYPDWRRPGECRTGGGAPGRRGSPGPAGSRAGHRRAVRRLHRGARLAARYVGLAGGRRVGQAAALHRDVRGEADAACWSERILRSFGVLGDLRPRRRGSWSADRAITRWTSGSHWRRRSRASWPSEFGRPDLPIVAGLPFGHTDPQWVLPLGVRAELDVDAGHAATRGALAGLSHGARDRQAPPETAGITWTMEVSPHGGREVARLAIDEDVDVRAQPRACLDEAIAEPGHAGIEFADHATPRSPAPPRDADRRQGTAPAASAAAGRSSRATGQPSRTTRLHRPDRRQVRGDEVPALAGVMAVPELAGLGPERDADRFERVAGHRLAQHREVGVLLGQPVAGADPRRRRDRASARRRHWRPACSVRDRRR